jgi:hypothetical protein
VWTEWQSGFASGRTYAAVAFDSARARLVVFGGVDGVLGTMLNDTWEYNGAGWIKKRTAHAPSPRRSAAIAYHPGVQRVFLFGGLSDDGICTDTWEYDGTDWIDRSAPSGPTGRYSAAMTYDATTAKIVLVGGNNDGAAPLTDTWLFDGASWVQATPATPAPPRYEHGLAYDAARARTVLYGGLDETGGTPNATWELVSGNWVAGPSGPSGRPGAGLIYDAAHTRVLLFGGDGESTALDDLWAYNGAWTPVATAHKPLARTYPVFVYDTTHGVPLLYGGIGDVDTLRDTWTLATGDWSDITAPLSPPGRAKGMMAYDAVRRHVVLTGGRASGGADLADTWSFDGDQWLRSGDLPATRYGAAVDFWPSAGVIALFGGVCSACPTIGFNGTSWSTIIAASPPDRWEHVLVADARHDRLVTFGGRPSSGPDVTLADPFTLASGGAWMALPGPAPTGRAAAASVFDAHRNRVAIFGGRVDSPAGPVVDDATIELDDTTWRPMRPKGAPSPRSAMASAYDATRGTWVIVGGESAGPLLGDTWEYDGARWQKLNPPLSPLPSAESAMAYDATRRRFVFFRSYTGETWELAYFSAAADEQCANTTDDDGDALADCSDPDCMTAPSCTPGALDCADPRFGGMACSVHGAQCAAGKCTCPGGSVETSCDNGNDDDCDGATDCTDPDCHC